MEKQSYIYKFLLDPQYRILRYLSLLSFFTIVTLNEALQTYTPIRPVMGNMFFFVIVLTILVYMAMVYFTSRYFIPRYLMTGRYLHFIISLIMSAAIFTSVHNFVYLVYQDDYNFWHRSAIIDNISSYVVYIFCIAGVIIPVFLRNWMVSSQRVSELKSKQRSSQVEQLKDQLNPGSFFRILRRTGQFVKPDPDKASGMLMKLSQLLRYQLYDCSREKVLLTAEINFLRNFLELENLYNPCFKYEISTQGNVNMIFIPSSILLPFVQSVMKIFSLDAKNNFMEITISRNERDVSVYLQISGSHSRIFLQKELLNTKIRLNTLSNGLYSLQIINKDSSDRTGIILKLDI